MHAPKNPLRGLMALQALTLVAVLAGANATPAANAFDRPVPTLPNAAAQRNAMIELMRQDLEASRAAGKLAEQKLAGVEARLVEISGKLDAIADRLPEPEGAQQ